MGVLPFEKVYGSESEKSVIKLPTSPGARCCSKERGTCRYNDLPINYKPPNAKTKGSLYYARAKGYT